MDANRPVGPALQAAISEALTNFAVHAIPSIVAKHHGTLIYAGGDDVLAALPTCTALQCARELQLAFSGDISLNNGAENGYYRTEDGRELLMMGPKATLSAGISVVHYKEDLRYALKEARDAEKAAKNAGRDALQVTVCRRAGVRVSALMDWKHVKMMESWMHAFDGGASDRWTYHLFEELPTLHALPGDAVRAEIRRQLNRSELGTRKLFRRTDETSAGALLVERFNEYIDWRGKREKNNRAGGIPESWLRDFLTLCQTASFFVRNKDS